jgi:hypothetical protein
MINVQEILNKMDEESYSISLLETINKIKIYKKYLKIKIKYLKLKKILNLNLK